MENITEVQYDKLMEKLEENNRLLIRTINEKVAKELRDMIQVDEDQNLSFAKKFPPFELKALKEEANRIYNNDTKAEKTEDVLVRVKEETKAKNEAYYNNMAHDENL
jgi:hypothetical protein